MLFFDLTGHGNTGYMSANAIWKNDTEYTRVYSPKFNSTLNDFIEMNVSNNLLDIARNQSFSFDGWIKERSAMNYLHILYPDYYQVFEEKTVSYLYGELKFPTDDTNPTKLSISNLELQHK